MLEWNSTIKSLKHEKYHYLVRSHDDYEDICLAGNMLARKASTLAFNHIISVLEKIHPPLQNPSALR